MLRDQLRVNMAVAGQAPAARGAHVLLLLVGFAHMCFLGSCQPYLQPTKETDTHMEPDS